MESIEVRPQSVMLSLLGLYLRGTDLAVATGSLIDVLGRLGIGQDAVRSTLTRMVSRDLLARHRVGRQVYVGLTPRSAQVLDDGHHRIWERGAVNRDWDGTWTLVAFTLPDDRRHERHDLRTRLQWAGFGPLQGGLWVAAGRRDVASAVAGLKGAEVLVVVGETAGATDGSDLVRRAFDVSGLAGEYRAFLGHWADGHPRLSGLPDQLSRQLLLHTDWLGVVRRDPFLPLQHLPEDWPAVEAERVFHDLAAETARAARATAEEVLQLRAV